jgi:histidine triad (HIT) family protein
MPDECLFCRIVAGEIPSDRVAEAEGLVAFRDISPRAPVHVLIVPERHVASAHVLATDDPEDVDLLARCFRLAQEVARVEGIVDGYRIATNVGERGGQSVHHLHFHVLGGRQLGHVDSGSPEPPA